MPGLSQQRALDLLASARVAMLGTIRPDGAPHLVPVTFAISVPAGRGAPSGTEPGAAQSAASSTGPDREAPVIALLHTAVDAKPKTTRSLRRLENIAHEPRVCVLADHYAEDWSALWWVRADGCAAVLAGPAELAVPLRLLAARYPQYRELAPAGPVIEVRIRRLTGWAAAAG